MIAVQPAGRTAWVRCAGCGDLLYGKRFRRNACVCPGCGYHARLTAAERLELLLDPGSARLLAPARTVADPLAFVDSRPYRQRLRAARERTGLDDAALAAAGEIEGHRAVVVVLDFAFLGGSMGCAVGEQVSRAAETALAERVPLLLVTASGGARMQEGALALMQMAKTSQALAELDEAGILTVSLVTDPTYGGVAASFATLADVVLAEPGARMGFAGPRVIEQTTGQRLPAGFQTAEFLLARGLVDGVPSRAALRPTLGRLLAVAGRRPARRGARPDAAPARQDPVLIRTVAQLPPADAWQSVQFARHPDRPTTLEYAQLLLDGFQELHGDRVGGDCPAIVGGVGRLNGTPVVLVGHQKGRTLAERVRRNFGMATPAGYRKAGRLMRLAEKLRLPVVTLVDTPGADPGPGSEEGGQAVAIAENLRLMSRLTVPVVAVVTGEGGSGGALSLAVADRVLAFGHAVYSVISPEGCAAILWRSPDAAPQAAAALQLGARDLLRHGIVDAVVPEPAGGAHRHPDEAAEALRHAVQLALDEVRGLDPGRLVRERRARFRRFGAVPHRLSEVRSA